MRGSQFLYLIKGRLRRRARAAAYGRSPARMLGSLRRRVGVENVNRRGVALSLIVLW